MKTYMFPGQGSQAKGMGGDLFDHFAEMTAKADAILGYSIKELCLEDPRDELGKTQFTQPALYVVNAFSYFKKIEDGGQTPDFVAGHSLGEFNALLAGGCFDFETGLRLVQKRGELMSKVSGGAMAAVLNASREQIEEILKTNGLNNVYLANYNTPSQIVISGLMDEIGRAQPFFQQGKLRYYPLATSGAFHSVFMRDAMEQFRAHLQSVNFAPQKVPVIANVTARPYQDENMLETLASQIASTVRWSESVQYLLALAKSRGETMEFEECGHGDVLTKLVHTIKRLTPEEEMQAIIAANFGGAAAPAAAAAAATAAGGNVEQKVAEWNKKYPIGSKFKSTVLQYDALETRTNAVVLFGHRAAVYMKGYNGYFDLDELSAA